MKKKFLYNALIILALTACTEQDIIEQPSTPNGGTEVRLPADVNSGELLIKFKPEMTDILDRTMTRATGSGGAMTRSGIPSTDEVLEILGGYHFERIFPIDSKNEERTRIAGLHLWYQVKFDEDTDLQEAAKRLSALGEISKVQGNQRIKRAYDVKNRRSYISQSALQQRAATRSGVPAGRFSDPGLPYQWHYINSGQNDFDKQNNAGEIIAGSSAGCDTGCYEAWQKCTGDPSVIVAVLDDGVMYTHPDLADNIWVNEGEELRAGTDADGNGYKDDKYGYNFVTNTANISWTDVEDIGHGTHVSGTIAAMNNGEGVCGIAGGDGTKNSGVKIMICQVFSGNNSVSLNGEAKAIKYAADNGAVILQCSWGYNSAEANEVEGYTPGPATEKEWADTYPLEKEILDYFINNAGSPNGVIDGGIAVFASGNEYAGASGFPGAYSKCVTVLLFLLVLLGAVSVMWKRLHRDPAQTRQDTILQEITEDNTWNTLQYASTRPLTVQTLSTGTTTALDFRMAALPRTAPVEKSWFSQVSFVGDSLTQGMQMYDTGLPGAMFCAYRGACRIYRAATSECSI